MKSKPRNYEDSWIGPDTTTLDIRLIAERLNALAEEFKRIEYRLQEMERSMRHTKK